MYVHACLYIPLSFVKLLFSDSNNNSNVKILKIIKRIIFALFILKELKLGQM